MAQFTYRNYTVTVPDELGIQFARLFVVKFADKIPPWEWDKHLKFWNDVLKVMKKT